MNKVVFEYNTIKVEIQVYEEMIMKEVLFRFCSKTNININYTSFVYKGEEISNFKLRLNEIIDKEDNTILAFDKEFKVNFNYKGKITVIKCKQNENIEDIFKEYTSIIESNVNDFSFWYMGRILIFNKFEIHHYLSFGGKEVNIFVEKKELNGFEDKIFKSNQIICPICGGIAQIEFNNDLISILGCNKSFSDRGFNNNHNLKDIHFDEFLMSQSIDESKIICDICKKEKLRKRNKSNVIKAITFYYCYNCQKNVCESCKNKHNENHSIINFDYKNYYCENHPSKYSQYCKTCEKNICDLCINWHDKKHKFEFLDEMSLKKKDLENELKYLDKAKENIKKDKDIIKALEKVSKIFENFCNIKTILIKDYIPQNRNYYELKNIEAFTNNDINKNFHLIFNESNYSNKVNKILQFYNLISSDKIKIEEEIEEDKKVFKQNENESNKIKELNEKINDLVKQNELNKNNDLKKINDLNIIIKDKDEIIKEKDITIDKLNEKVNELTMKIEDLKESQNKGGFFKKLFKFKDSNSSSSSNSSEKDKIIKLMEDIKKKDQEINELKSSPYYLKPGEKLMTIIFVSDEQNIHFAVICKNTDIFSDIEKLLYEEYKQFSEESYFYLHSGSKINRFKSLEENQIKNNSVIMIYKQE